MNRFANGYGKNLALLNGAKHRGSKFLFPATAILNCREHRTSYSHYIIEIDFTFWSQTRLSVIMEFPVQTINETAVINKYMYITSAVLVVI